MDPKSFPQNLDPKLKEAYDRVMGFAAKPPQTQPSSQTSSQIPNSPDPGQIGADTAGLQPEPSNQFPPPSTTMAQTPTFSTPSQTTVKPPEISTYPRPQQTMQYETPVQTRPIPYQTESFSNNPIRTGSQSIGTQIQPEPRPVAYQPLQEPQAPISAQIAPSPITEPATQPATVPQTVTQPEKKSSLLTIVIIVLGIIFFLIYTFFWIRFFDVTLPFELPF